MQEDQEEEEEEKHKCLVSSQVRVSSFILQNGNASYKSAKMHVHPILDASSSRAVSSCSIVSLDIVSVPLRVTHG